MAQRTRSEQAAFSVAAVAAAAACSTANAADSTTVRVESDLTESVDFSSLTVLVNPELHRPETALLTWGVGSGGTEPGSNTQFVDFTFDGPPDEFFVLGVTSLDNVVLSFVDPTAFGNLTFDSIFGGFDHATVATMIRTGDQNLASFITAVGDHGGIGAGLGGSATAIDLGSGSTIGTFDVTIVPSPGTALPLGAVALGMYRRRRSR